MHGALSQLRYHHANGFMDLADMGWCDVQLAFLWATYGGTAGAVILFLGIILFARWKRLLFIPDATSYSTNNQK